MACAASSSGLLRTWHLRWGDGNSLEARGRCGCSFACASGSCREILASVPGRLSAAAARRQHHCLMCRVLPGAGLRRGCAGKCRWEARGLQPQSSRPLLGASSRAAASNAAPRCGSQRLGPPNPSFRRLRSTAPGPERRGRSSCRPVPPGLCPIFGTQLHAADHPKSRLRTHLRSARCGLDRALRAVPRQKAVIDVDFVLAFGLLVLSLMTMLCNCFHEYKLSCSFVHQLCHSGVAIAFIIMSVVL